MIKLNTGSPTLTYSDTAQLAPGSVRRLLVLIPADSDYTATMSRTADLAATFRAHVLLLGVCRDSADGLSLHRNLVTLSALLQDARVWAETKVETRMNWVDIVKSNYRSGDLIVCFAEQRVGLRQRPVSQILASDLRAPIYVLSTPELQGPTNWLYNIILWSGIASIIAGAFVLQLQLLSVSKDWAQTTLLIISVLAELWLIWIWNSLFG
jgi:hypothetical protein